MISKKMRAATGVVLLVLDARLGSIHIYFIEYVKALVKNHSLSHFTVVIEDL